MLNSIASKILPLQAPYDESIGSINEESGRFDETELTQWQLKFKACLDKLITIQHDCTNHATYWSAFFENQLNVVKQAKLKAESSPEVKSDQSSNISSEDKNPADALSEFEQVLLKSKAESQKKLTDFEKKIASKIKDMKTYIETLHKLFKKRSDQKIEVEKYEYYCRLYENKEAASNEDENALQLTAKEKQEFENLKRQLAKTSKDLVRIETQMAETFPAAMSMYNEFVDNLSDVVFYDQQEIYDNVYSALNTVSDKFASLLGIQVIDSWRTDLLSIKKQTDTNGGIRSIKKGHRNSGHHRRDSTLTGIPVKSEKVPKEKVKVNSSGMRSLNLDPKKGNLRRSLTTSHRRHGSKSLDVKSMVSDASAKDVQSANTSANQIPDFKGKRQSIRSFSSLSFDYTDPAVNNSLSKDEDTASFNSSLSSLHNDESFNQNSHNISLDETNSTSPIHLSPPLSPARLKRSSVLSNDSSNNNRLSIMSTTSVSDYNRMSMLSFGSISNSNRGSSIYKRGHLLDSSPAAKSPNQSTIDIISELPVTDTFEPIDAKLRKYSVTHQSMSAQVYLHLNDHYKQAITSKTYDYRQLVKLQKSKGSISDLNSHRKSAKANADFNGTRAGCLSFVKSEILIILSQTASQKDWWVGESQDGRVGEFPNDLVSVV